MKNSIFKFQFPIFNLNDNSIFSFNFQFFILNDNSIFKFQFSIFNLNYNSIFKFKSNLKISTRKEPQKVVTFLFFLTFGKSKKSKNVYYSLTIFFLKKSFFWLRPFHQDCIVPPLLYTFLDYFK